MTGSKTKKTALKEYFPKTLPRGCEAASYLQEDRTAVRLLLYVSLPLAHFLFLALILYLS